MDKPSTVEVCPLVVDGSLWINLVIWNRNGYLVGTCKGKPVDFSPQMLQPVHLQTIMAEVENAALSGRFEGKIKWITHRDWYCFEGIPEIELDYFEAGGNIDFLPVEISDAEWPI